MLSHRHVYHGIMCLCEKNYYLELICLYDKQFDCMAKYLSWDLLFQKSYYATAMDELSKNQDAMKELEDIGKDL